MKKLLIPIIIILLAIVVAFYFYSNQSVKISAYKGIELGMTMDEVIYAFGEPEVYIEGEDILSNFPTKPSADKFKKNGSKGFNHWRYGNKTQNLNLERLDLIFDSKKQLSQINCTNYAYKACFIADIYTQISEKEVKDILGKPSKEHLNSSNYIKIMVYQNKNRIIRLKQQKVITRTILDLIKNKIVLGDETIYEPK